MTKLKSISDLTIKNKMILIVLLVTFLVHSIGFVFIYVWDINRIKLEMQTGLVLNTKLIANNCVVPLTFGDDQQAAEALSHLENIEGFETACLLDKAGNVFATHPSGLNKRDLSIFIEEQSDVFKDDFFYVNAPVMFQNVKYGTLFIKANSVSLKRAKWNIILTLLLLSLVLDLLAIILASKMQRYISNPIVKLENHFEKLTRTQDFSLRIEKRNNDEVGHLYDEFNSLISQIHNRRIERDSAEKKLRESQQKLDLALQGGGIGVWEWDTKTDRRIWDPKMEKMFGLEEGTFKQTTKAYKACMHPDDVVLAEEAIQHTLVDDAPYDFIYRVVWKNKEIKFIRAKALLSRDEDKNPVKMTGVCFDVTESKEAEYELTKYRENLEDLILERTKNLEDKNAELENFNQLFIDREFRIKELKEELATLKPGEDN